MQVAHEMNHEPCGRLQGIATGVVDSRGELRAVVLDCRRDTEGVGPLEASAVACAHIFAGGANCAADLQPVRGISLEGRQGIPRIEAAP